MHKAGTNIASIDRKSTMMGKIPYKEEKGKVIRNSAYIQDMTELEKAEKENKKLQERIARAEKMETIGLLAGDFAHDCNNILNGITGYIEIALLNMSNDNRNRKLLTASLESADKLAQLLQDLLALARRDEVKTNILNLNQIISSFIRSSSYEKIKAHNPDIKVNIDLDPNLININD